MFVVGGVNGGGGLKNQLKKVTPEERVRLGENGRTYFEAHYRLQSRVTELVTHIEDVIARHKCPEQIA